MYKILSWALFLALGVSLPGVAADNAPLADVHLHYHWDQTENTDAEDAVRILRQQNVVLAVVSSIPPEMALELRQAAGDWVLPFFMPYLGPSERFRWFRDQRVLPAARRALESGEFVGIGEVHLIAGMGPGLKNEILHGLFKLAIEFEVPLLIHIETSSHRYFLPLCRQYPQARILLAHAGGLLDAKEIGQLMHACRNIWVEFSARDHWRYIESPIVDDEGRLLAGWRALIEKYPHRFMIGSDPVWPVDGRHRWDEADTGWLKMPEYLDFHRKWLSYLPAPLRNKVMRQNAQQFFAIAGKNKH